VTLLRRAAVVTLIVIDSKTVVLIDGDVTLLRRAAVVTLIVIDSNTVVLIYGSMTLVRRAAVVILIVIDSKTVVLLYGSMTLVRRAAVVILIVIDSKTVVLLYGSMILARRATIVFSIGICSGAQIPVDRSGAQCLREKVRVVIAVPVRMAAALIHWRRLLVRGVPCVVTKLTCLVCIMDFPNRLYRLKISPQAYDTEE
jgi:hypothetical protein